MNEPSVKFDCVGGYLSGRMSVIFGGSGMVHVGGGGGGEGVVCHILGMLVI